jgi:hypothetical protein
MQYFTVEIVSLCINAAIAIAAFLALGQIAVARKTAHDNSRRESIKLALEIINFFLKDFIEVNAKVAKYFMTHNIKQIQLPVRLTDFSLEEAESLVPKEVMVNAANLSRDIYKNHEELMFLMLDEMNDLEYVSAPFVASVADSDTGFRTIGRSFCHSVESLWFEYLDNKKPGSDECDYYLNTRVLYNRWKSKLEKSELGATKKDLENKLSKIPDDNSRVIGT